MPKSGQARVLTPEQRRRLFEAIRQHRYPEKVEGLL